MNSPFQYCPACGQPRPEFLHRKELQCQHCDHRYFHNVAAAVGVFIRHDRDVLFAVRGREPGLGLLDLPGGFVEPGETLEQGLRREVGEELGIALPSPRYLFSFANEYLYKQVLYHTVDALFEVCVADKPKMQAADDVAALEWITLDAIDPAAIAFTSIRQGVAALGQ